MLYGENRYRIRSCDERDMDVLVTYLPLKLNNVMCEEDLCNAYVLPPSCARNQVRVSFFNICKIYEYIIFNVKQSRNCDLQRVLILFLLQITVNILIVPSHIVKLMTVDPKHCNVLCLKAIQDKLSLILSRNLQILLGKIS